MSNHGKFESEPAHTEYFWNLAINGDGEDHSFYSPDDEMAETEPLAYFTEFVVDGEEEERFNLNCGDYVIVWEDSQGFVMSRTFTKRDDMFAFFETYLDL